MKLLVKRLLKNELYLLFFLVCDAVLRMFMGVSKDLAITLKQAGIMFLLIVLISVIQHLVVQKKE